MESKDNYPFYRKYADGKTFFKITSESSFEELKILGIYYSLHSFEARILPDRNFIADLTSCGPEGIEEFTEEEYQEVLEHCLENLKRVEF
jgi:predicted house-cleaning noncanonical NTP pyrophosphatase (MazG superfamily)